jgi:beta-N-acetylhexosaminidase
MSIFRILFFVTLLLHVQFSEGSIPDVNALSLEEKVGQVLMVHFHGEEANQDAQILIQQMHVGAFIYYNWCNGLHHPDQIKKLSEGLQKLTLETRYQIPLLIAVDQEGGEVSRLQNGFTKFPCNGVVGDSEDPNLAYKIALTMGSEMRAVGINMNLAPVVDVKNPQDNNSKMSKRSYSAFPEFVVSFAAEALRGYKEAKIFSVLKHFPGHGDVAVDSHFELPILNKAVIDIENIDLYPFEKLHMMTDAIMVGHIKVPVWDEDHCATLSKIILTDILRNKIGFQGVIISDSLVMQGVLLQTGTVEEAAIQALQAGCDLLILGGMLLNGNTKTELSVQDIMRVYQSILEAVRCGRIPEGRLNDAVSRVLTLKTRLKLNW